MRQILRRDRSSDRWWSCYVRWLRERSLRFALSGSILRPRLFGRRNLPCSDVDCIDGGAGDIGILQRLDVEIKALDRPEAVGQGVQQSGEVPHLSLCLGHADGGEPESLPGRNLREPSKVS